MASAEITLKLQSAIQNLLKALNDSQETSGSSKQRASRHYNSIKTTASLEANISYQKK